MFKSRKIIISTFTAIFALIAIIIPVVAVFAARNVTLNSNISISYKADGVIADIEFYAMKVTNGEDVNWNNANKQTASFDLDGYTGGALGTKGSSTAKMEDNPFELIKTECVVLKYVFKNNNQSQALYIKFDETISGSNGAVYYSNSDDGLTNLTETTYSSISDIKGDEAGGVMVSPESTFTFFVRVAIADVRMDANFSLNIKWTLQTSSFSSTNRIEINNSVGYSGWGDEGESIDIIVDFKVYMMRVKNGEDVDWNNANHVRTSSFDEREQGDDSSSYTEELQKSSIGFESDECVVLKCVVTNLNANDICRFRVDFETTGSNVNVYCAETDENLSSLETTTEEDFSYVNGFHATGVSSDLQFCFYVRLALDDPQIAVEDFTINFDWGISDLFDTSGGAN